MIQIIKNGDYKSTEENQYKIDVGCTNCKEISLTALIDKGTTVYKALKKATCPICGCKRTISKYEDY